MEEGIRERERERDRDREAESSPEASSFGILTNEPSGDGAAGEASMLSELGLKHLEIEEGAVSKVARRGIELTTH